ncbi:Abcb6 [Scenedesmus sp. PABB004]|nr:Abcb6 [Scenedesmus sp. PABB004]
MRALAQRPGAFGAGPAPRQSRHPRARLECSCSAAPGPSSRRDALLLGLAAAAAPALLPLPAQAGFKKELKKRKVPLEDYSVSEVDGLRFFDSEPGRGREVKAGDKVVVHFDCKFKGIDAVSSRYARTLGGNRTIAEPFELVAGGPITLNIVRAGDTAGGLFAGGSGPKPPPALSTAVIGMKAGGRRVVYVDKAELGYTQGNQEIPAGAAFQLEDAYAGELQQTAVHRKEGARHEHGRGGNGTAEASHVQLFHLRRRSGELVRLHFTQPPTQVPRSGAHVVVQTQPREACGLASDAAGLGPDRRTLPARRPPLEAPRDVFLPDQPRGEVKMKALVMQLQVCGEGPATTPENLTAALFEGQPGSPAQTVEGMLRSCSYSAAEFSLALGSRVVAAVVPIPCTGKTPWGAAYDSAACPFTEWSDVANEYVRTVLGIEWSEYKYKVYVVPPGDLCAWGGMGWVGCRDDCRAWVSGDLWQFPTTWLHELGHNLYLNHAGSFQAPPGGGAPAYVAYKDDSGAMGHCCSTRCFNAPHSFQLGWSRPIDVLTKDSLPPGEWRSFTLPPRAGPGAAAANLLRVRGDWAGEASGHNLFLEYRRGADYDGGLLGSVRDKVTLYSTPVGDAMPFTTLEGAVESAEPRKPAAAAAASQAADGCGLSCGRPRGQQQRPAAAMASQDAAVAYYFAAVSAACVAQGATLALSWRGRAAAAVADAAPGGPPENYEHKYRGFKYGRTAAFAALTLLQLGLTGWRCAAHWGGLSPIDWANLLVLAAYSGTLVVLVRTWPWQLSLRLSGVLLLALLEPGLLFAEDVTVVQPGGALDAEHVARVVVHGVQLVLLLGLVIAELIIQQHQLLQRSTFVTSGAAAGLAARLNGASPSAAAAAAAAAARGSGGFFGWGAAPGGYERLPSDAEEGKPRRVPRLWQPGDSRWAMAASAFSFVWPSTPILRARLAACLLLILAERAINLAAPIAFKHMVEALSDVTAAAAAAAADPAAGGAGGAGGGDGDGGGGAAPGGRLLRALLAAAAAGGAAPSAAARAALAAASAAAARGGGAGGGLVGLVGLVAPFWGLFYPWVLVYLAAFLLRGGSGAEGLLANVRDLLWIPITQAAFCRISCDVFGHLLALDLHFHVHRRTGQIMRILDRGTSSIQDTVEVVLFNVLPQLVDIAVAVAYLAAAMAPWVGGIVLVTVGAYVPLTICITERRGRVRKVMNALDNAREGRATDVLLNYETVKIFGAEGLELRGFHDATTRYQAAEYWQLAFLSLLSMVQSAVVWLGLAAGLVVCVWGASRGSLTVGDTVLFLTMMSQLYVPLTYFGSYYRQVTKALIDMENMFELLATAPRVTDAPGARRLAVTEGRVDFREVVFSYTPGLGAPVLKGVTFTAPGGKTLAVVGSTGSGKSTLLRLLLRFYDPQGGAVLIDGTDVRACRQASVRAAIAVVPQDSVLFNETIIYNIRYGRPTATDAEVYEAAEIAHIHQHLQSFPHGYSTRVGERGLRLSGGEKQRVAFARAVLKRPAILVLDEATSALDSLTEKLVQDSLATIRGRCTQLIVAHRLSTVMDADRIVVLQQGCVAEVGGHAELIEAGGLYASMWARQQDPSAATPAPSPEPGAVGGGAGAQGGCGGGGGGRQRPPALPLLPEDRPPEQAPAAAGPGSDRSGDGGGGGGCSGSGSRPHHHPQLGRVESGVGVGRLHILRRVETGTSDADCPPPGAPSTEQDGDAQQGSARGDGGGDGDGSAQQQQQQQQQQG